MESRERVKAALNFEKTDRIPRYEIFLDGFIRNFNKKYKTDKDIYEYYDKIDIRTVWADQDGPVFSSTKVEKREGDASFERDTWGRLLLRKENAFFEKELEAWVFDKNKVDTIDFNPAFLHGKYESLDKYYKSMKKTGFAPVSGVLGLYMGCSRLRGQEQFLIDMAEDLPFCQYLAGRLAEYTKLAGKRIVECTETTDTAIWVYDEFSSRLGPMFSPNTFERLFLPCYKEIFDCWKASGMKNIILHCDGNCLPLLDLIIEAGFTGIQGLAPTAGMWLPEVKKKYGKKLALIGGMCNISTLAEGTPSEIEHEAESIVEAAKEGGVIIGTHSIDSDIPVGNYEIYYSVLQRSDKDW